MSNYFRHTRQIYKHRGQFDPLATSAPQLSDDAQCLNPNPSPVWALGVLCAPLEVIQFRKDQ